MLQVKLFKHFTFFGGKNLTFYLGNDSCHNKCVKNSAAFPFAILSHHTCNYFNDTIENTPTLFFIGMDEENCVRVKDNEPIQVYISGVIILPNGTSINGNIILKSFTSNVDSALECSGTNYTQTNVTFECWDRA